MNFSEINKLYFLGIGGIGMSAIARYFNSRGAEVFGYDKTETALTKKLVEEGMTIHYDEDPSKIPGGVDLVVWTPAVPREHLEMQYFIANNIPVKKRAEVLGIISRNNPTIAIAGTHGKTTTSSLVTHILRTGGILCTAFLGGIAQNYKSNYVEGNSDWVVVEADEYDRSFLQLSPKIAAIMSMDPDHLDIYGDVDKMHESGFMAFVQKVDINGSIYVKNTLAQFFENQKVETFGINQGQYRAERIRVEDGWFVFDFVAPVVGISWEAFPADFGGSVGNRSHGEIRFENVKTAMPGRHNIENAVAAAAIALQLGVTEEAIRKALTTFKGIKRRFQFIHRDDTTIFIDDYAHHPTEIRAAVGAAKELFPGKKLTGIFQPHLFSRTRDFQNGFAEELDKLDEIFLLDIYPAREKPIPGVTSDIIFNKMKNPNKHRVTLDNVLGFLKNKKIEVLMTIGAGDIDTVVEPIGEWLQGRG
ncbi:MAG TPA: UDP-N-acetylmuramate--L-alanine ligase [Bacteroidetes bacterium]|nr:UDP-N-acetylmuramate--L-alanine ligase [Bacteroidota bacterium]